MICNFTIFLHQGLRFTRDMIVSLAGYGKGDVQTFNAVNDLRKDQIVFAVNPRTDELIQQFKPFIDSLSKDEKIVLVEITKGSISTRKIEKATGIMSVIPILAKLHRKELINQDNSLTEQGEILATLINLIPEL